MTDPQQGDDRVIVWTANFPAVTSAGGDPGAAEAIHGLTLRHPIYSPEQIARTATEWAPRS
jgi:hypothetical protein